VVDEQGIVEGVRVVIVQLASLLKGQLVVALVVAVVGDEAHFVLPKKRLEPTGSVVLPLPEPPAMPMIRLFMSKNLRVPIVVEKSPKWGIISLSYIITHFALF